MPDRTDRDNPFLNMLSELLTTKLYPPPVSTDLEPRVDLIARLETGRHRALTLISAPTGYGKSTLASMWIDASDAPSCWVSLDEEDNDLPIFLAYVVAAIHSVFPDVLLHAQTLLEVPVLPPSAAVVRTLLNDLERLPRRILLVLDDLHAIRSQAVYDVLAGLLRHPSPKLHLVLISRRDPLLPLPSLRAYRQITEIRTRDLRFSTADTANLLTKMLHREIDDMTAAAWTKHTEGWVTALCLAAIALRERSSHDNMQPGVRLIDSHYLQKHLLEEVINRLAPAFRDWLLTIAWLERFCPALCEAVHQVNSAAAHDDLTGEAFVQRLQDNNLFVIALDRNNHWFRLHHLFRELLQDWSREQYDDRQIAALHRRAGAWFAGQDLPDEAIRHLILGGDHAAAEQVVRHHRYALMNSEQWSRLERWLRYFPDDVVASSAMLTSTVVSIAMQTGQYPKTVSAHRHAEQLLAGQGPKPADYDGLMGELSTVKAVLAVASGDSATLDAYAQDALQSLPADALFLRSLAYGTAAAGLQMRGRFAEGCRLLEETMDDPQWTSRIQAQLMLYLCYISFLEGDLTTTQAWAERVRRSAERRRLPDLLCAARHLLGVVHFLRHEFDAAEPCLSALVENNVASAQSHVSMGAFALSLIYEMQGDSRRADAVIERLDMYLRDADNAFALALVEAFTVELSLRRGNLRAAKRQRIGIDFDRRPPIWFFYIPQLTPIKLLLAEGTSEALDDARAALDEFEARMRSINRNLARVDGLALLALVCEAQGDTSSADTHLTTALLLAQDAEMVRPFVDLGPPMVELLQRLHNQTDRLSGATAAFVEQILAAFPTSKSAYAAPLLSGRTSQTSSGATLLSEPLTPRELQVLQQLAAHLTPAEIAARHVVSVATVRWQIKCIYRKLDVRSRKEAVRRSSELNLV